jgi:hypothetical protein
MIDVHDWHMVWHMMYIVDGLFMIQYSLLTYNFLHGLIHELVCMIGIHLMAQIRWLMHEHVQG